MLVFARNFLTHPRMLGSPFPSPHALVRSVLGRICWAEARVVVEYGPGVGDFTAEILRRMRPEARLVAIETNRNFVQFLGRLLPDSRLSIAHASAAEVGPLLSAMGCERADYIVSGIPFSMMHEDERDGILNATRAVLKPRGAFLVYQYSRRVFPSLKRVFTEVRRDFRLLGLVPYWLFSCRCCLAQNPGRYISIPPLTDNTWPVTKLERGLARKQTA
jgi:phospholipid N-methyltransferase